MGSKGSPCCTPSDELSVLYLQKKIYGVEYPKCTNGKVLGATTLQFPTSCLYRQELKLFVKSIDQGMVCLMYNLAEWTAAFSPPISL